LSLGLFGFFSVLRSSLFNRSFSLPLFLVLHSLMFPLLDQTSLLFFFQLSLKLFVSFKSCLMILSFLLLLLKVASLLHLLRAEKCRMAVLLGGKLVK
jgi:hypothetical protein